MFEKLLKHLTNAPVAVALAFLLVGAPAAPVVHGLPSSGVVYADAPPAPPSMSAPINCGTLRWLPPQCTSTGVIVGVIVVTASVVTIIIFVDWLWPLTNREEETLRDQLHDRIWDDGTDDEEPADQCAGLDGVRKVLCNLGVEVPSWL